MFLFYLITLLYGSNSLPLSFFAKVKKNFNTTKHNNVLAEIKSDPQKFISEVQNLDPAALRHIISLLEELREKSEARENELDTDLQNKKTALSNADGDVVDAGDVLDDANQAVTDAETVVGEKKALVVNAEGAVSEAQTILAGKQADATAAESDLAAKKEVHKEKKAEKNASEKAHNDEVPDLNDEQQVLTNVIEILEDLHGKQNQDADNTASVSELRLVFTKNHGSSAICVDDLRLFLNKEEVSFPSDTTVTDTGLWSGSYASKNLLSGVGGYYCSESGSCNLNQCNYETVTIGMPDTIKFDEYSLKQADGMGYNPSEWILEGKPTESSEWQVISSVTDFNFPHGGATETWPLN